MTQNSSFKNFSYIGIARVTGIILQAIFYLIFAALLEPEAYGELNYIVAIAGTAALVSRFGLNHTITVFRAKNKTELSEKINTLVLLTSTAASLILLNYNEFAAILTFAFSMYLMNQHNFLGLKKYKKFLYVSLLKNLLIIILPILFYLVLDIPGIILGMALSNLIGSFSFLKRIKPRLFFDFKNNFGVIVHNFGVDASTNLSRMADKLIIAPLFGFFIVGVYQFNMQILFALELLPAALHVFLLSEESSGNTHKKLSFLVILGSILIAFTAIILSPYFVNEFFPKYSDGIPSLQILVLAIIPLSISAIFTAKLQAKESTKIGYSAIVRIGSLLVLLAALGNILDLIGLSLAVLFSIILNTGFLAYLYLKHNQKN